MRASAGLGSDGARVVNLALAVAWNAAAAAAVATAAVAAVSLAIEPTDPVGLTEAGDEAEEEEFDAGEVADAEGRVESGALAEAGEAADIAAVAEVPDASEASVPRAWPWSFARARSEVAAPAAPAVAAAASRPLPLPLAEALASIAGADMGAWSAVAGVDASAIVDSGLSCADAKASGMPAVSCVDHCERPVPAALDVVDALVTSSVVSDALASVVATVLASAPESEPAGKALMVASAGMDVAIWLVPTVGMPRSVATIV